MGDPLTQPVDETPPLQRLTRLFDDALGKLEATSRFAKATAQGPVLDIACRLLAHPGGAEVVYDRAGRLETAGVFHATDWAHPETLQPTLVAGTLEHGDRATAALEMLSDIRMQAIAAGDLLHDTLPAEQANHFLAQVLALNLNHLFRPGGEAERAQGTQGKATRNLFAFIAERTGYGQIFEKLIAEIERILAQRPILVDDVKVMITRIAVCLADPEVTVGPGGRGADRLISALYGPTTASREDPGLEVYAQRLDTLDDTVLLQEARGFARAMHDTGLVSPYHAVFLTHVAGWREDLVGQALGLSTTGADAMSCYTDLVSSLIQAAVTPDTPQAIYGLALMLERGVLFNPAVPPALWGQIGLRVSPAVEQAIAARFGTARPAATILLAGTLSVLGQPLGIGQGNNPTCQSARALSMWALSLPDYLLHLLTRAGRDDEIILYFEGQPLSSATLAAGLAVVPPTDVDPVSTLLVPHLDRIYMEMGRLCQGRAGDPHAWINPEMHGWWVGRGTALAVDLASGALSDYDTFVRRFYALYHPLYNGNRPVIHPQPAGIAVTDSAGRFIGWHAISIQRVGIAPDGGMRVYFYNPNNDGGQDWGQGVVVSTDGRGERFGESSLPVAEFASRLYLFHYDPCDEGDAARIPAESVETVQTLARTTWAADR